MEKKGFTLLELLIVISLMILAISFYPNMHRWLKQRQLDFVVRQLLIDLQYGLRTAQVLKQSVTICISDDQLTCTQAGDQFDWTRGWLVFTDPQQQQVVQTVSQYLRSRDPLRYQGLSIRSDANIRQAMSFNAFRKFGRGGGGLPNGRIRVCLSGLDQVDLIVSTFGEVRSEKQNLRCP